jgi:hypothetical protein
MAMEINVVVQSGFFVNVEFTEVRAATCSCIRHLRHSFSAAPSDVARRRRLGKSVAYDSENGHQQDARCHSALPMVERRPHAWQRRRPEI